MATRLFTSSLKQEVASVSLCRGRILTIKQTVRAKSNESASQLTAKSVPSLVEIDFADARLLADNKTPKELIRSLFILNLCSSPWLVKHSQTLMQAFRRIAGTTVWRAVLQPTFYDQFVGGDNEATLNRNVCGLIARKQSPMVMVSIEEPLRSLSSVQLDLLYRRNFDKIDRCLVYTKNFGIDQPMMQLKFSALVPHSVLDHLSQLWIEETGSATQIPEKLVHHVYTCMQTGHLNEFFNTVGLSLESLRRFQSGLHFMKEIGKSAQQKGIILLVDAEYTTINRGITVLAMALALAHNTKTAARVWNTHQGYLKQSNDQIKNEIAFLHNNNLTFGCKLVRGAYMMWEKENSQSNGASESPVYETHKETNDNYDTIADFLISEIELGQKSINVIIATHNEHSLIRAASRKLGLSDDRQARLVFGQIYGMADNLSYALGQLGRSRPTIAAAEFSDGGGPSSSNPFRVYKSIPFGSLEETLPYLARRAVDNCTVFSGVLKERGVLWRAALIKWRGWWRAPVGEGRAPHSVTQLGAAESPLAGAEQRSSVVGVTGDLATTTTAAAKG